MVNPTPNRSHTLKKTIAAPLRLWFSLTAKLRTAAQRIAAHAHLASLLKFHLPLSVVVQGEALVYGTGAIQFGEDCLLYPALHLETQGAATIAIGDSVVLSRGVHLVAMHGITIGRGSMIGEYTSIRDANHQRTEGTPIRDAGHTGAPIIIGQEVWIGRGVTILSGVHIADGATIGANAVVTRNVPQNTTVVGVPARPIRSA